MAILGKPLSLVRAAWSDCELFMHVRNDPANRRWFNNTEAVSVKDHQLWYANALHDIYMKMYVICLGSENVGYIRVDGHSQISIALYPKFHRKGIGTQALRLLPKESYEAHILDGNKASLKAFLKADFKKTGVILRKTHESS